MFGRQCVYVLLPVTVLLCVPVYLFVSVLELAYSHALLDSHLLRFFAVKWTLLIDLT